MRSILLVLGAALLVASTVVHGAIIAQGGICGNGDKCVAGSICYANYCIFDFTQGTNETIPAGAANRCSAADCCGAGLTCVEIPNVGGFIYPRLCILNEDNTNLDGIQVVTCTGEPGPAPDLSDLGNTTDPDPGNGGEIGRACEANKCCIEGLVCYEETKICGLAIPQVATIECDGSTPDDDTGRPCESNNCCSAGFVCHQDGKVCGLASDNMTTIECTGLPPVNVTIPDDTGRPCESNNCCSAGFVCYQQGKVCGPAGEQLATIACTGVPPDQSGQNVTDPNDGGTGSDTGSGTGTGTGASGDGDVGVGRACESNVCCPNSLVCYQIAKVCGPATAMLATIACTGQPPVTGGTNPDPIPGIPTGNQCGNTAATKCSSGNYCIANFCVAPSVAGAEAINGLGNRCAADNCCPNNLGCSSIISRCAVAAPGLATITCTATGGVSSGETVTPADGSGNPQTVGAASTVHASPLVALLIAATIGLAKMW